jgi:hypothetical protein
MGLPSSRRPDRRGDRCPGDSALAVYPSEWRRWEPSCSATSPTTSPDPCSSRLLQAPTTPSNVKSRFLSRMGRTRSSESIDGLRRLPPGNSEGLSGCRLHNKFVDPDDHMVEQSLVAARLGSVKGQSRICESVPSYPLGGGRVSALKRRLASLAASSLTIGRWGVSGFLLADNFIELMG